MAITELVLLDGGCAATVEAGVLGADVVLTSAGRPGCVPTGPVA